MGKRIIIIGGLSAGPSAAAKARRENEEAEIILFEKTANISYATCGIPYALSGKIRSRDKLMVVKPDLLRKRFKIDVRLEEAVLAIDPKKQEVSTHLGIYPYDKLIYATGGSPLIPPIKNLDSCDLWTTCKTIEDFDKIVKDKVLDDKKYVAIIGAGLIGLEAAENLQKIGKTVHIIEKSERVLPILSPMSSRVIKGVLEDEGIQLHLGTTAQELDLQNQRLIMEDGSVIQADYLIIGIGIRPNTQLLPEADKAGNGALIVDAHMRTSLPNIYAAGDCVVMDHLITGHKGFFPMGTHSNKGGRAAGAHAAGNSDITFDGAYGTAIVQVFDYAMAKTGLTPCKEQEAFPYNSSLIIAGNTAGFYPDPSDVYVSLYYEPDTKVLVGAEVFGKKGVDKRIDVLSTAIYAQLTLHDLQNLDLAYAPSFSPAKDPVIVAGFAADNVEMSGFDTALPTELEAQILSGKDIQIIDVRNPDELEKLGKVIGAINIPLDELRDNLDKISDNLPKYIYCAKGLRGYLATKILENNGFRNLNNVAGGMTLWKLLKLPIERVEAFQTA
ncbi:FAD-dependent oxidoreductase [Reichenbachiella ulvae]|uniref:FAD-dependent oxidoreductase n=1 Tax=Reichenbachiella ulvae TaxID=2980104 RepID=A0ABT3CUD6_9BACT|nr:FAD-dependent oxidoreductase [Reichenbachiella ulvae]MCV9386848.1 FAD-dependent oxidoreductase [Reichenbachiella ulvae]